MKTKKTEKKKFGYECERILDDWFCSHNWCPVVKNMSFPGGEIDRIYSHNSGHKTQFCMVEAKGFVAQKTEDLNKLCEEWMLRKFLKVRQLQRLFKIYQHWQKQTNFHLKATFDFRLIIVVLFRNGFPSHTQLELLAKSGFKCLRISKKIIGVSFLPDFSQHHQGSMQIRIK